MSSDKRLGGFWLESYAIIMMRDVCEMTGAGIGLGQSDLKGTNVYASNLRVKRTFRKRKWSPSCANKRGCAPVSALPNKRG